MTATNPTTTTCPTCDSADVIGMTVGTLLCTACGLEWDPAHPPAPPAPAPKVVTHDAGDVRVVDDDAHVHHVSDAAREVVEGLEANGEATGLDDGPDPLAPLIGREVVLNDGRHAIVRDFPDDDHVLVELATGRKTTVDFDAIAHEVAHVDDAAVVDEDMDDDAAYELGETVLAIAEMVITAGVASLEGTGADAVLVLPPAGWLPDDTETIPLLEQGAAVAVAMLIRAFDLPTDVIVAAVAATRAKAQSGGQTEGTEDESDRSGSHDAGDAGASGTDEA